ncbi:hypothetical protein A2U01_0040250, partial [Trifolium medium]|nr:hypothetical protein [Trifolium medium]
FCATACCASLSMSFGFRRRRLAIILGPEVWVFLQGIDNADEYPYQFSGLSSDYL